MRKTAIQHGLFFTGLLVLSLRASAASVPTEAYDQLKSGLPVDLIVEYDDGNISSNAATMRQHTKNHLDDANVLQYKSREYKLLKDRVDGAEPHQRIIHLRDYSHLPLSFKRFSSRSDLDTYVTTPGIKAVYFNRKLHAVLAQSLPLINQPAVANAGEQGAGTTVAVIDNGIDFTNPAFGSCTSPGIPAGCKVVVSQNFGSGTTDTSHGTNVSGIVLGVAPASKVAMLNAFSGTSAYTSDIISAINWVIANRATYNIVAINMSLGDGTKYTSTCKTGNPFYTPITSANNAGINVVVAAGNEAYTNGLSSPACTPGAISVGAVYDANIGGVNWGSNLCTDSTTAADKVTCFSNSASFLTVLAPGALITAAGITEGGTSQATPHIAGAVAVLRSTFPNETLAQIQARMTNSGVNITDARNGLIKPRMDLLAAARPSNDNFSSRFLITGNSGSLSGTSLLSTKEAMEPNHAGNSGGKSVWWKWSAPATGQVSLDTHGSNFDTLLAVYTGNDVKTLTKIASNDNDGVNGGTSSVLFQAQAGTEYEIAVDGASGAAATVNLNWALNPGATANLSTSISGPVSISPGITAQYNINVSNAGPQSATNVWVSTLLPTGAIYASGPSNCTVNGSSVSCNLGTMPSGTNLSIPIQITWNAVSAPSSITASVSSDLPDSVVSDNAAIVQVFPELMDADTPTLPEWGMVLMAIAMMGTIILKGRTG